MASSRRPSGQASTRLPPLRARRRLVARVAPRAGPHLQPRGARTDGAEGWQPPVVPPWPDYTVSWDISPAPESRWDPATALLGEPHPQRLAWGGIHTHTLITFLGRWAPPAGTSPRGTMTKIWRVGGRSGQGWGKVPGDTSCTIAWRRRGGAGPPAALRRGSTCGRGGSTASGMPSGGCLDHHTINGARARPPPRRCRQQSQRWRGRPDQQAVHKFWAHSNQTRLFERDAQISARLTGGEISL